MLNRRNGPEQVMQLVEERAPDGYNVVTDVLSQKELEDIAANYKRVAGFQVEGLNAKPPIVAMPTSGTRHCDEAQSKQIHSAANERMRFFFAIHSLAMTDVVSSPEPMVRDHLAHDIRAAPHRQGSRSAHKPHSPAASAIGAAAAQRAALRAARVVSRRPTGLERKSTA